jgi:thiamine transport system ATP-binding protein
VTLEVIGVTVTRGEVVACDEVDLSVARGETVAVLGPSGSGKSSLLRAIAGLEPLRSGSVRFDGVDLAEVAVHRRGFGVMFQDLALFPHLDVAGNVEYGPRVSGVDPTTRRRDAAAWIDAVGLTELSRRRVHQLSGGERQRVALARVLASGPRLLLLDEPLGSLDRRLRSELTSDLRRLVRSSGVPTVVVTHDHDEAFALADRIVVLRSGRIVQDGPPESVWRAPIDEWTSDFVGHPAAIDATAEGGILATPWGNVAVEWPDDELRLVVPSAAVHLADDGPWSATVESVRPSRDRIIATVGTNGATLDVSVDAGRADDLVVGARVRLAVGVERLIRFAR